ncbi:hypothetical protein BpHYR1_012774 [Brachionus plicatilis]|uniref:Uncharacterized protein n=1 Tax=Brachionus plicatilis TaxID=10195 RepID=A0A3M7STX1_BRAPC|nr:hypothetical protein BpHYR1_012774 [Brachionus plicatilis]
MKWFLKLAKNEIVVNTMTKSSSGCYTNFIKHMCRYFVLNSLLIKIFKTYKRILYFKKYFKIVSSIKKISTDHLKNFALSYSFRAEINVWAILENIFFLVPVCSLIDYFDLMTCKLADLVDTGLIRGYRLIQDPPMSQITINFHFD